MLQKVIYFPVHHLFCPFAETIHSNDKHTESSEIDLVTFAIDFELFQ